MRVVAAALGAAAELALALELAPEVGEAAALLRGVGLRLVGEVERPHLGGRRRSAAQRAVAAAFEVREDAAAAEEVAAA